VDRGQFPITFLLSDDGTVVNNLNGGTNNYRRKVGQDHGDDIVNDYFRCDIATDTWRKGIGPPNTVGMSFNRLHGQIT